MSGDRVCSAVSYAIIIASGWYGSGRMTVEIFLIPERVDFTKHLHVTVPCYLWTKRMGKFPGTMIIFDMTLVTSWLQNG
jgi:hypothetical protein